jgi:hypothetical protein
MNHASNILPRMPYVILPLHSVLCMLTVHYIENFQIIDWNKSALVFLVVSNLPMLFSLGVVRTSELCNDRVAMTASECREGDDDLVVSGKQPSILSARRSSMFYPMMGNLPMEIVRKYPISLKDP